MLGAIRKFCDNSVNNGAACQWDLGLTTAWHLFETLCDSVHGVHCRQTPRFEI